ncbi:twin-arginine translocase TatA/TatE family subunit [Alteromonas sp. NFXS44]|uniref:twin-arginine translocase TatA/TatE family subunit n=1 Tax=Alteromonas sp. NFXS44 TaxID=2818435 RepID=UPI0032DFF803
MGLNLWQILLVLLIVVLLFGRGRIPALMGDIASGIRSFKQGLQEEEQKLDAAAPAGQTESESTQSKRGSEQPVKAGQPHA